MKSKIKIIYEEIIYNDDNTINKYIGIINNSSIDYNWNINYTFIFKNNRYIIFKNIINMMDYMLYSDNTVIRTYISDEDFDVYLDSEYFEGKFEDYLEWTND